MTHFGSILTARGLLFWPISERWRPILGFYRGSGAHYRPILGGRRCLGRILAYFDSVYPGGCAQFRLMHAYFREAKTHVGLLQGPIIDLYKGGTSIMSYRVGAVFL